MKIQKLIYILPIFLVGCHYPTHGTLHVNSPFTFKDHHGKKSFELAPGDHSMEVKRDEGLNRTVLKMKLFDKEGKQRKIKIRVPDSVSIPDNNGSFAITSEQSGQPFDLFGNIETTETDLPPQVSSEPCGYGYGYYYDYYSGTRLTTFHQHDRTIHIVADFKTSDKDESFAQYKGSRTHSQLVIDAIGPCISP